MVVEIRRVQFNKEAGYVYIYAVNLEDAWTDNIYDDFDVCKDVEFEFKLRSYGGAPYAYLLKTFKSIPKLRNSKSFGAMLDGCVGEIINLSKGYLVAS